MKTIVIIPARYASTRYPGKPLVEPTHQMGRASRLLSLVGQLLAGLGLLSRFMLQQMIIVYVMLLTRLALR